MTCLHGRRSKEGPRSWGSAARSCHAGALPDRAASQSPRQAPADTRGCPDRNRALACIKHARTGVSSQAGHQRLWDRSRSQHRRLYSFLSAGHRYKHSGRTTLRCNCSCLSPLGASARAERQPPYPDTPPRGSNKSKRTGASSLPRLAVLLFSNRSEVMRPPVCGTRRPSFIRRAPHTPDSPWRANQRSVDKMAIEGQIPRQRSVRYPDIPLARHRHF